MVIISQLVVPEAGLVYQSLDVKLKIDSTALPSGALYISENSLHWKQNGKEDGISIPWPKVSVHAITNNPQSEKSVYMMLDFALVWPGVHEPNLHRNGNGHVEDEDDEDEGHVDEGDEQELTEMWLLPSDPAEVERIYGAMTQCQVLNPDPNDSFSEDEDDFMEAVDEDDEVGANGEEEMQNLNLDDESKYEDAD